MQQVMRNKNEATELFKGGNFAHAAARYARALAHTSKFFDLSTDDEKEVNDLQVRGGEQQQPQRTEKHKNTGGGEKFGGGRWGKPAEHAKDFGGLRGAGVAMLLRSVISASALFNPHPQPHPLSLSLSLPWPCSSCFI